MEQVKRIFKKVGNKVIVKQILPNFELPAKEVSDNITQLENNIKGMVESIGKAEQQIKNLEGQIKNTKDNIPTAQQNLKDLCKFKEWAEEVQVSAIKLFVKDNKDKMFNNITAKYEYDELLTSEENDIQKFHQYMHSFTTSPELSVIASGTVISSIVNKGSFDNPWKVK